MDYLNIKRIKMTFILIDKIKEYIFLKEYNSFLKQQQAYLQKSNKEFEKCLNKKSFNKIQSFYHHNSLELVYLINFNSEENSCESLRISPLKHASNKKISIDYFGLFTESKKTFSNNYNKEFNQSKFLSIFKKQFTERIPQEKEISDKINNFNQFNHVLLFMEFDRENIEYKKIENMFIFMNKIFQKKILNS